MADELWTQALLVQPPVFLGRRLHPFSLGHCAVLRALGNPYAYARAQADAADLAAAVVVCSRGMADNRRALMGGALRVRDLWRLARRVRRVDFTVADASFRQYLADYSRRNVRVQRGCDDGHAADAGEMLAPVEWHLHRHLTEERGWSDDAAWDCPLIYAWALVDVSHEWRSPGILQSQYDATLANYLASESEARARGDNEAAERISAEVREFIARHRGGGGR